MEQDVRLLECQAVSLQIMDYTALSNITSLCITMQNKYPLLSLALPA